MTPPPAPLHNNAVSRLVRLLADYLTQSQDQGTLYVPRAGIVKGPNSWLEPDLFYVAAEAQAFADARYPQYLSTADLVIDVISPGSAIYDRNTKADTYAVLGVKELWLVDEALGIIEVRTLEGDRYGPSVVLEKDDSLRSTVLKGLEFRVGNVFGA
jgi:Uma2 family endonuclease